MGIITTSCPHDCGGKCLLKVHMEDDKPVKITTVKDPEMKACTRGLSYLKRLYAPNRLKHPLMRNGEKRSGNFKRISWATALNHIADEMKQIKGTTGNSAFLLNNLGGELGRLNTTSGGAAARFFNMFGGCVTLWSVTSNEGASFASKYMLGYLPGSYGYSADANESDDLLNSRLIILWGCNPAETIFGTGTRWYLTQAKKKGIEIIAVDPRNTESVRAWASQWIPIRPTADTAMLAAMAYVIIQEKLVNRAYLDKYTVGFDVFKNYILGDDDAKPKTPAWAEKITGVPVATIEKLARTYATNKPACLLHGWAPGRVSFGEQFHRMAITLSAMTGNIGVPGGSAGALGGFPVRIGTLPVGDNPLGMSIKRDKWADCILQGKSGGYPADIEMMWVVGANPLNQTENVAKGVRALKKLKFLVVIEQFMTPTAKYADLVLPVTTHMEKNDIYIPYMRGYYAIYGHKVIEPMYECKSDLEIFTELSRRLDIPDFNTKTEEEWLREFVADSDIPDYDTFKKKGVHKFKHKTPWIAFQQQIENPEKHPFPTPSGKIEIYSETLAKMNFANSKYGSYIPPIPKYISDVRKEGYVFEREKTPLQLITPHFKYRTNSIHYGVEVQRKQYVHEVWINPADASDRRVKNGDTVRVSNALGAVQIKAKVTPKIIPGVVSIPEGAYYEPDRNGIDQGGCANVLTSDCPSPAGAFPYNSAWVQIEKC